MRLLCAVAFLSCPATWWLPAGEPPEPVEKGEKEDKNEKPIPLNQRHTVGYKLKGKVLESYLNNKKTSDTSTLPKFTDGFDTGQVGFSWSGSVQSFLFKVTMEGRLDPDWVAKQLGDKPEKAEKAEKGKKAAGAK